MTTTQSMEVRLAVLEGLSDRDLVAKMLERDNLAWREFHRRFDRLIYRCIHKVTCRFSSVISSEDVREIYAMLLTEKKFKEFTPKEICDTKKSCEVLICLSCESRGEVDDLVRKAVTNGGSIYADPKDYGFMYAHGYQDIDGHTWELIYMDPARVNES